MSASTNKNNSEGCKWFDRGDIRELKDNKYYQILDSLKSTFSGALKIKKGKTLNCCCWKYLHVNCSPVGCLNCFNFHNLLLVLAPLNPLPIIEH